MRSDLQGHSEVILTVQRFFCFNFRIGTRRRNTTQRIEAPPSPEALGWRASWRRPFRPALPSRSSHPSQAPLRPSLPPNQRRQPTPPSLPMRGELLPLRRRGWRAPAPRSATCPCSSRCSPSALCRRPRSRALLRTSTTGTTAPS